MRARQRFPRAVVFLGIASLLTDVAGEVVYPLLPAFLTGTLGTTVFFVGVLEGVAETVASLMKFVSGVVSDRTRLREPIVFAGYSLTSLVRPLLGLATGPVSVFVVRFMDRVGKGFRTSPRDAWLASLASPLERGRVFGFHRAMDHVGAMIGPLLASAYLWWKPGEIRSLFLLTWIPGVLAVFFIWLAWRAGDARGRDQAQGSLLGNGLTPSMLPAFSLRGVWGALPKELRSYFAVLALFTLGNASDAFLLLKLQQAGVAEAWLPLLWAALHLVKSVSSLFGGWLSDRMGDRFAILSGWGIYAVTYATLAWSHQVEIVIPVFLIYGFFYGLTEGPEKSLLSKLVPEETRGTAFGIFHLILGVMLLPASVLFGFLWYRFSPDTAFMVGSAIALCAIAWFLFNGSSKNSNESPVSAGHTA